MSRTPGRPARRPASRPLSRPILFATGHAPAYRIGGLAALHELEGIEVALFGGRFKHGGERSAAAERLSFAHRHVSQRQLMRLAASWRHRAVVASSGGRIALPAAWAGARAARLPLILWTSLWAQPASPAHLLLGWPLMRTLYRSADAVVAYGPHVADYVRRRGARNVHIAPQAVDNEFWAQPLPGLRGQSLPEPGGQSLPEPGGVGARGRAEQVRFLFAGRPAREKGLGVLMEAWRMSGLQAPSAALVLVGVGSDLPWVPAGGAVSDGIICTDPVPAAQLRRHYAAADVLVLPSIPTATFREPWGLVVNEAMNQGLPVIVSDAVGAAAGGLVRNDVNGLIVPAGDPEALAAAMQRLHCDAALRARLGRQGALDVSAYTHEAWARGFSQALASVNLSRQRW